ncbi:MULTISPECIES: hypothetical protein [unclassified Pantoea]|uniref:hypothetical protein n=1 Tax=unclassified Pantoea TaxID=2630326 RepID=UPI0012323236|nr:MULTISPECIES: hypothetical protein [unclassified Pantoea]KAA5932324.1 hypothetical protein F3I59_04660 [Pantoea sp. VH_8]KAA5937385.1 hypothetical protein F3I58_04690 [Pantoea sp. VH_4]
MPSSSPAINSFNAGEFSPLMLAQTDFQKWKNGCKKMLNFIPRTQGPAERRGGTYFVSEVNGSGNKVWLAKFEYNTTQAFLLEFGPGYVKFYSDHGVALDASGDPLVITSPYSADDLTNSDGAFGLSMVQSGDVIYICSHSGNLPPYKLSRNSNTNWTLSALDYTASGGPFADVNSDRSVTVYTSQFRPWSSDGATRPDGTPTSSGLCAITANAAIFNSGMIGSLFYIEASTDYSTSGGLLIDAWEQGKEFAKGDFCRSDGKYYEAMSKADTGSTQPTWTSGTHYDGRGGVPWRYASGGWGTVLITQVQSSTIAIGKVIQELPASVAYAGFATSKWARSDWSDDAGFPTKVAFYKSRLVFAGRNKLWFSVASDFENFTAMSDGFEVQGDDGINVQIEADSTSTIQWMAASSSLIVGTASSELTCSPSTTTSAFGPDNIQIVQESRYGSKGVNAISVGNTVLFVQRAGRKVRAVTADYQSGSYSSTDLSVLAEHMTSSGIVDFAWQQEPDNVVWVVLTSGELVALTYNAEQEVIAWHRHDVGGVVESVATIPDPSGNRDDVWMVVRRTINGVTRRYVEYITAAWDADTQPLSQAFYIDCGLTYSGPPVKRVSGLGHLEGRAVSITTDGAAHPDVAVSGGAVDLQWESSVVNVGLPFTSELVTLPFQDSRTKRSNEVSILFVNSLGGKAGNETAAEPDTIETRDYSDMMDKAPGAYSDMKKLKLPGGYDLYSCIRILQDQPLPMTICAVYPRTWTTGE